MNSKKLLFFNAICPITIGAFIYYLISPDVLFVKKIDAMMDYTINFHITQIDNAFVLFLRNYFLDMIWGYALIFALFYILDNDVAKIWKLFFMTVIFSIVMESIQVLPFIQGTFDVLDIVVEILAEMLALFIIKKLFYREENRYEKKN